jgi:hypothetical protein
VPASPQSHPGDDQHRRGDRGAVAAHEAPDRHRIVAIPIVRPGATLTMEAIVRQMRTFRVAGIKRRGRVACHGSGAGLSRRAIERVQRGSREAAASRLERQRRWAARLLLLCLLLKSSWLTAKGNRHVGTAEVLHSQGADG